MIKLKGVNKYFNKGKRNEIHVINETTLDLGQKGLVALLGPSGSGKTTLLNAIGGLDRVNEGDIFVDGVRITGRGTSKVDEVRNLNIGYIFQDYKLVDNMTVYENVAMVLRMIGIKDEAEIKKRIDYVLETLGIYRYRNRMADMLSGGERQRVGIARAIVKNPKIIIADEPTGNLDSANTIEIMNIIKAISRDRLVVLVTHEVELAKFYASRIIELKDGTITDDYENITGDNLDYRMDNRFYLKDFEKQESVKDGSVSVNFYGGPDDNLDIDVVVKNGNIYIKTKQEQRIEVLDSNSAIELVDDHYREMDKTLYESYDFEFDKVVNSRLNEKYSSIIGVLPSLKRGFKKIVSYPLIKKLLFIGFVLAGIFITYSLSSIYASLDIQDEDFIRTNKEYLEVTVPKTGTDKFEKYEKLPGVKYVFPGSSTVSMIFPMDYYYQTYYAQSLIEGSLTDIGDITEKDIVCGRMPENSRELVLDKLSAKRMLAQGTAKQTGIVDAEQLIGKTVRVSNMKDFTIVGLTDKKQPVIYAAPELFTDIIYNCSENSEDGSFTSEVMYSEGDEYIATGESDESQMVNYATFDKEYTIKKGRLPENAYETAIPADISDMAPLNKEIDQKVNGKKLKVVGYYESPENINNYLVNEETIRYSMIEKAKRFTVAPADSAKEEAFEAFKAENLNVDDAYNSDREEYKEERSSSTKSTVILGLMMLIISLIEILLMTRSSFLSRIKEIGIYRAIGVKKTDIYKMFLGEIIAITTVSSLVGICLMSYIFYHICQIEFIRSMFAINPIVFFGAVLIVYVFNAIVGLIPVFNTMRKTPAAILSRYDVD